MKMKCKQCGTEYNEKTSSYRRFGNSEPEEYSYAVNDEGRQLTECLSCGVDINPNMVGGCKPEWMTPPNLEEIIEEVNKMKGKQQNKDNAKGGCLHC